MGVGVERAVLGVSESGSMDERVAVIIAASTGHRMVSSGSGMPRYL